MGFEWVAYRGNAEGVIENSVGAVLASSAAGADVIELDVQVSKDEVAYLFHDDNIDGRAVADLTYAQILELVSSEQVPRLETVLNLDDFNGVYLLDLKFSDISDLEILARTIRTASFPAEQIAIQSGDIEVLTRGNEILPKCQYFYLERLSRKLPFFTAPNPEKILEKVSALNIQGISIKGRRFVDSNYINSLKSSGLKIYV